MGSEGPRRKERSGPTPGGAAVLQVSLDMYDVVNCRLQAWLAGYFIQRMFRVLMYILMLHEQGSCRQSSLPPYPARPHNRGKVESSASKLELHILPSRWTDSKVPRRDFEMFDCRVEKGQMKGPIKNHRLMHEEKLLNLG
jgi:hypothetical protein